MKVLGIVYDFDSIIGWSWCFLGRRNVFMVKWVWEISRRF